MTSVKAFQKTIWEFYKKNKRDFPWRAPTLKLRRDKKLDSYKILISEVMLQQTQTYRAVPKYNMWIKKFPNFETLNKASFSKILKAWSGLGYNRRALYLKQIAQQVVNEHNGKLPMDEQILVKFPGIGKNTACSVIVFSTNIPLIFIETNIRRVFIHEFFQDKNTVDDKEILKLVEKTIDTKNPREWYYGLMDYGAILGKLPNNPNSKSKHYKKQSRFEGSLRQIRGAIIRELSISNVRKTTQLKEKITKDEEMFKKALKQLEKEQFIHVDEDIVSINV